MRARGRLWSSYLAISLATLITMAVAGPAGFLRAGDGEADPKVQAAREQFFEQKVRPLLAESCYSCHGDKKQKGGLRLDSVEMILKGGESGPAVVPGKPEESLLVDAVNHEGIEMPPAGKLTPAKIEVLTRWVSIGAPWPSHDRTAAHATPDTAHNPPGSVLATAKRALWSLQPVRRAVTPVIRSGAAGRTDWACNPIDRFILKALEDHGLTPAPEAERAVLIRRVTFDLTGLPPTPEEVDAYLADEAPNAYERLVDRLLASPRYGQRWGRHWLDLVRYAESDGYRQDAFRPAAWRYRDYVVAAFNTDKPYDRFLTEQLAGDELDPDDPDMRVATGYLRLGTYEFNQRNVRGQWADILNDITDVTGEVFLGLSIGCARCHDHKFDPILQKDYYRLQAFFTPLLPRDDLTMARSGEWAAYLSKRTAWERAAALVLRQLSAIEKPYRDKGSASAFAKFPDEIKEILRKPVGERAPLERQLGALAFRQIAFEHDQVSALLVGRHKAEWQKLQQALKQFDALRPVAPAAVFTATDVGPVSPPLYIPGNRQQEPIAPGFPCVFDPAAAQIEPSAAAPQSTGRRLALARWMTRPDNPLATRVIVNRIWQHHFGRGLVATPSDFGHLGEPPSHPELLDWLATELVARGWHFKPLHRLILTSATYRQATQRTPLESALARRVDSENRLLWERTAERLDAEEIRDAMLAVSGELEPVIGGPSVPVVQPRRTVDTRAIRNIRDALLDAFDAPDGTSTTATRTNTTTVTQALLLFNGAWSLARAEAFASRLEQIEPASSDVRDKIALAYRLAFGRAAEKDELTAAVWFVDRQAKLFESESPRKRFASRACEHAALADFCHVLFNSNEFLHLD